MIAKIENLITGKKTSTELKETLSKLGSDELTKAVSNAMGFETYCCDSLRGKNFYFVKHDEDCNEVDCCAMVEVVGKESGCNCKACRGEVHYCNHIG